MHMGHGWCTFFDAVGYEFYSLGVDPLQDLTDVIEDLTLLLSDPYVYDAWRELLSVCVAKLQSLKCELNTALCNSDLNTRSTFV